MNLRLRSLNAIAGPSVVYPSVCLSVTFVHSTQPVEIFGNVSSPVGVLFIRWHLRKIFRRSSQGNFSVGGSNARGLAKYSNFEDFAGHILEKVQNRR